MKKLALSLGLMAGFFLAVPANSNAQCDKEAKKAEAECDSKKEVASSECSSENYEKTAFVVEGNCGMCEDRIEKAAGSVEGVKKAKWDKSKDMLTVYYSKDKKVDMMNVHKAVAEAGHDTSKKEATKKAYASLPNCCAYRDEM